MNKKSIVFSLFIFGMAIVNPASEFAGTTALRPDMALYSGNPEIIKKCEAFLAESDSSSREKLLGDIIALLKEDKRNASCYNQETKLLLLGYAIMTRSSAFVAAIIEAGMNSRRIYEDDLSKYSKRPSSLDLFNQLRATTLPQEDDTAIEDMLETGCVGRERF